MKQVTINNQYTYQTDLDVKIGDKVVLPTPAWLVDVKGSTWIGTITGFPKHVNAEFVQIISKS